MKTKPFTRMLVGRTVLFEGPAGSFEALVLGETRGALRVRSARGLRTLLKSSYAMHVDGTMVRGAQMCRRPHDRMKGA